MHQNADIFSLALLLNLFLARSACSPLISPQQKPLHGPLHRDLHSFIFTSFNCPELRLLFFSVLFPFSLFSPFSSLLSSPVPFPSLPVHKAYIPNLLPLLPCSCIHIIHSLTHSLKNNQRGSQQERNRLHTCHHQHNNLPRSLFSLLFPQHVSSKLT